MSDFPRHHRQITIKVWHEDIGDDLFVTKVRSAVMSALQDTAAEEGFAIHPDGTRVEWKRESRLFDEQGNYIRF